MHRVLARTLATMSVTVKPTTLGAATINKAADMQTGKWIGLKELDWTDQDGKSRKWEVAGRKTTAAGGVDGATLASSVRTLS